MSLLSSLGGLVGMAIGGPTTAFLGATVGSAADGGSLEDALKAGVMGAVGGGSGGPLGGIMNALGGGGNNPLSGIMQTVGGAAGQGGGNKNNIRTSRPSVSNWRKRSRFPWCTGNGHTKKKSCSIY